MNQKYAVARAAGKWASSKRSEASLVIALGCALGAGSAPGFAAVGVDSTALREAVTVDGIRAHQQVLQSIADDADNTRASGTAGYDASADYVEQELAAAGYLITVQPFSFPFFQELSDAILERTSPLPAGVYVLGTDFLTMEYSGAGDVTALLQPTNDIVIPPGAAENTSNSGCEPEDFDGFVAGNIALIQRGTCSFAQKAQNAEAAGAAGVIVFNEGQPGRQEVLNGTLGAPGISIPVVGTTFALGEELYTLDQSGEVSVHLFVDAISETRETVNVIGETEGGRADRVVVVGAHLDSVPEGPGINDNGSGSATILEIAVQMANLDIEPRNRVRFAFWGAEESGLFGSAHYVSLLSKRGIKDVAVNLNFDMLGSPNYVRFVYDGDGSDTPLAGPNGSATIEDIFLDYFADQDLATEPTAFDGRSDYGPFIDVGIPAGGLFSGAEEIKSAEEAAIYGGTADVAYDPCYHQACDTVANNNNDALDELGDAAAHTILQFAMTTAAVKGTSRAADKAIKSVELDSLTHRGGHAQK
jgi:Zn-dependent M28 family amino/carboxypeptidase